MTAFAQNEFAPSQGQMEYVYSAPASATVIAIGDLLYQDPATKQPKCASAMIDQKTETLNQDAFQQYFLGVAEQASAAGETKKIRIATRGVKEFDCPSATYTIGQLLGAAEKSSGTALEDRTVKGVTLPSLAIGRCVEESGAAATKVMMRFESTILYAGLQAQAVGSSSGAI